MHLTTILLLTCYAGICHDFENASRIAKLLYYESSRLPSGETTSFDEYISRCDPEQVRGAVPRMNWEKENRAYASNESAYHRFKQMSSLLFRIHQNAIYFLCAPNRELAEASPYFEAFKRSNKEVMHLSLPPQSLEAGPDYLDSSFSSFPIPPPKGHLCVQCYRRLCNEQSQDLPRPRF